MRVSALRSAYCAGPVVDSARGSQPAMAAAPSTLKMMTEIAAMIRSGYNQPFGLDVFDVSNAACMMNSPAVFPLGSTAKSMVAATEFGIAFYSNHHAKWNFPIRFIDLGNAL